MVVLDAAVLLLVLNPDARGPRDPATGEPVARATDRIRHLIGELAADRERVVVPTPALSELLVHAGDAMPGYLEVLNTQAVFRIAPFDQKAAIEAALMHRGALARGGSLKADAARPDVTRAKVKFDRQIVAIAVAEGAHTVYSDDDDVVGYARQAGLKAVRTRELALPPEDPQGALAL